MSSIATEDPFVDYPLISQLPPEEKAKLLRELGDEATADEVLQADTKSLFKRQLKPWEHTSHSFGFLPAAHATDKPLPLFNAGQIEADQTLRGAAVVIRLDKLRVANYPGFGTHRILFDFYARNSVNLSQQEDLHYNSTFRAREEQEAAAVGLPIFVGLNVGELGLAFKCNTINVANEGSQKALDVLESDVVKAGLQLAKTVQPAIGPLSQIAIGLTKAILSANKNVRVQEFQLGLDFETAATGARLAQGSYFAVQLGNPSAWNWSEWLWHPSRACLISKSGNGASCPYNYIVFRVSRNLED